MQTLVPEYLPRPPKDPPLEPTNTVHNAPALRAGRGGGLVMGVNQHDIPVQPLCKGAVVSVGFLGCSMLAKRPHPAWRVRSTKYTYDP